MKKKRISIRRRAGKIGFMGKGVNVPSRHGPEIVQAVSVGLDDDAILLDDAERDRCREDATIMPSILRRLYSKKPEVVVRPDSGELVADILDKCLEERTPATPRGQGTAGLGGAVPVRGGVVIDLSRMSKISEIDGAGRTVTVEAGCTWKDLEGEIAGEGLALRAYPSSAAFSTVGGWVSTGGLGIGTMSAGSFHSQIRSMEVAVPSGILLDAGEGDGRYSIRSFSGSEGQTGIVTRVTIPVKELPERRCCHLLHLRNPGDGPGLLVFLSRMEHPPLLAKLVNSRLAAVLSASWRLGSGGTSFILVADEGTAARVEELGKTVKEGAARRDVEIESIGECSGPWDAYFSHYGPAPDKALVLAGEIVIGSVDLARFLDLLGPVAEGKNLLCESMLVDSRRVLVRASRLEAFGGAHLLRDVPTTARVVSLAASMGGIPYGVGIWNSTHSRLALGEYHRALREIKRETDRLGILNPGKFFGVTTNSGIPVPGWIFRLGIRLASPG